MHLRPQINTSQFHNGPIVLTRRGCAKEGGIDLLLHKSKIGCRCLRRRRPKPRLYAAASLKGGGDREQIQFQFSSQSVSVRPAIRLADGRKTAGQPTFPPNYDSFTVAIQKKSEADGDGMLLHLDGLFMVFFYPR